MKKYNKILEAINRGINLALDDYDDEEIVNLTNSSTIDITSNLKDLVDLKKMVVDLGLPSGTLWCKYNLDVDPNLLTKAEDWYGKYYAWGETEPKNEFTLKNYKWFKINYTEEYAKRYKYDPYQLYKHIEITKYNTIIQRGKYDRKIILDITDDAAYLFDNRFKMPTRELFEELLKYTKNKWVENYLEIKGLNGKLLISKINKKLLFIPAAGFCSSFTKFLGELCYLWSSSLYLNDFYYALYLYCGSRFINIDNDERYIGFAVRPILNL